MVYVTGDMHGDLERFSQKEMKRLKKDDTLIICGDFGFIWEGSPEEEKALKKLSKKKFTICFVDGAHENFELLSQYPAEEWNGGKIQRISSNILHLLRGETYTIEGHTYFTMGGGDGLDGGVSDVHSWWKEELPSKEELISSAQRLDQLGCDVDVIITHEPPAKTKEFLCLRSNDSVRVTAINNFLQQLGEHCNYQKWFFGCLHMDKRITSRLTAVFREVVPVEL